MKTERCFFIALFLIVLNMYLNASDIVPLDSLLAERRTAFTYAAHRAIPQWFTGRLKPVALATILCAPFFLELIESPPAATSILLPITAGIMARQFLLTARDVQLYNNVSLSRTHLLLYDFPSTDELNAMDNHHQILQELAEYTKNNGTYFEKALLLTPGLRGYKKLQKLDNSVIKFNKKGP